LQKAKSKVRRELFKQPSYKDSDHSSRYFIFLAVYKLKRHAPWLLPLATPSLQLMYIFLSVPVACPLQMKAQRKIYN